MAQGKKRGYLIADLLPDTGLHLIAGPSGAGKTTWQFQMLQEFINGDLVLGHATNPGEVFYIAADRDEDEIEETMARVGLQPNLFPVVSLIDSSFTIEQALGLVPKGTALVIVEGLASLVEDGRISDYKTVASFIRTIRKMSQFHHYSVLGSVHATKTKEGERFENPRQRILGSVAWAAYSGNVILIEPEKPSKITDNGRVLLELPRNSPQQEHRFILDERGRFVPSYGATDEAPRLLLLSRLPNTEIFTRAEAIYLAKEYTVAEVTIDRWLKRYVSDGHLVRIKNEGYKRAEVPRTSFVNVPDTPLIEE